MDPYRRGLITGPLERFSHRCRDEVSAVPDVVGTLVGGEQREREGDELADMVEAARAGGAEEGFQLGEGQFDGIEVGTIGRQEAQEAARRFDRRLDFWVAVDLEVVEDDDVARADRRHEHLVDIGAKRPIVQRAVEDGGGLESVHPQGGHDGVGFPVPARRVIVQPRTPQTAAEAPEQVRRDPTFIEKPILPPVTQGLPRPPLPPRGGDIRAALFLGVDRFF